MNGRDFTIKIAQVLVCCCSPQPVGVLEKLFLAKTLVLLLCVKVTTVYTATVLNLPDQIFIIHLYLCFADENKSYGFGKT